ncbi:MAG: caspase family protein [Candidatus Obscuribacterales bacterium]|nr:caspase family protein [Candidatus Obscuribacterales bacterium]
MATPLFVRRGLSFALAISLGLSCVTPAAARQAYSTIQGNIREEAEIEPYAGGKKVGPAHDWELLCKIEGDPTLKERVIKSAEEGSLDHVFILGCMYMHGKGIEKNQASAFELFKAAANKGHSNSQNNLGFMYEDGIGVKKDLKQAFAWYKKAADYNNPSALCNLGNMYEHGKGIPVNVDEALNLYQKSSVLGNKTARQNVYGIEFEREGKWKLRGIESQASAPAAPQAIDKKTKKPIAPAVVQRPSLVYNPTSALFKNETPTNASTAAPVSISTTTTPTTIAAVPVNPPAVKAASTPAKATTQKPLAPNLLVLNALNKAKSSLGTTTAQAPAQQKQKGAQQVEKPNENVPDVAQAPTEEVKPEPQTGLSAGTPTLTAILQRLSKGTSLEQAGSEPAKPESANNTSGTKPIKSPVEQQAKAKIESQPAKQQDEPKLANSAPVEPKVVQKEAPAKVEASVKLATASSKDLGVPAAPAESKPVVAKVAIEATPASAKPTEAKSVTLSQTKTTAKAETAQKSTVSPSQIAAKLVATKPAVTSDSVKKSNDFNKLVDKVANGANRPIRDKWALVIGITDFQDPDIPDLQFSAKDATDFYNYLVKEANFQPDHVRLLLNEQATQRRVLSELGSKFLARVVKPDDLVVLYFSTHGSPAQLDPRGKNYLVACDSDSDDLFATGIEMQKLLDSIQGRVLTDRVLLVMDACHSGFAAADAKGMSRIGNFNSEDLAQGSGQLVICSSAQEERAWESTRYQNGVFTSKLLDGLRSKGPKTSLVEAFTFAREAVGNEVKEDRPGAKQTPVLKGKWNGNDLVVATPAVSPQMVPASVSSNLVTDSRNDLVATSLVPKRSTPAEDEATSESVKPSNDNAPRSGIIYLDSQFFSVKGDPKALAREYNDAIKNNPSDPELYFIRAKALMQLEDWHNALTCLSDAIQLSPNKAQYYLGRAYVNFRLNKKVLAEHDLEQAKFYDHKLSNNVRFHM